MVTAADLENLLALLEYDDELIRHNTFSNTGQAHVHRRQEGICE